MLPLLAWRWQRRDRSALAFPSVATLGALPAGRPSVASRGGISMRLVGLFLLIFAFAGPRWPDQGSRLPTEGISIAFVLDASESMTKQDFRWGDQLLSRFDGVRKVFRLLVEGGVGLQGETFAGRNNDLVALVACATRPETACPLTLDHAALLKILDAEEPRNVLIEQQTNPGDAIAWALYALQKAPTRRRVLIFLTDGESNVPPPALKPRQAAQLAGNMHVPIYAIDAAPEDESQGDAAKARETLNEIAKLTDGRFFRAADGAGLTQALAAIDRLERDTVLSYVYRRYHEGYAWFALAALACWLAVIGLEATWWRKSP